MQTKDNRVNLLTKFDDETGIIEGYANTFDFKDHANDVTVKGAFNKSLERHKANGTMPLMYWQHDRTKPIGKWLEMHEDHKGLYVKGQLIEGVQAADEARLLLKADAINGLSIGYIPVDEEYDRKSKTNYLKEVDLMETSIVSTPCNEESRVTAVKGDKPTERELEKHLKQIGFSGKEAKTIISNGYKAITHNNELDSKLDELLSVLA